MTEALSFTASDGLSLAYDTDDFTDPWKKAPTLLLLHAAMAARRCRRPSRG
jgi:3-oxoadipate enol-lactonase